MVDPECYSVQVPRIGRFNVFGVRKALRLRPNATSYGRPAGGGRSCVLNHVQCRLSIGRSWSVWPGPGLRLIGE